MPPQPKTTEFAAPSQTEIMLREILQTVKRVEADQGSQGSAIRAMQSDLQSIHEWKGTIIQWKDDVDTQRTNNSMRAKQSSIHDGEQDTKLTLVQQAILDTQAMMKQQNKLFGIDPKTLIEWVRGPNAKRDVATILILIATIATSVKEVFHK